MAPSLLTPEEIDMSVNPDINPAGWADPDDEDYGDEIEVRSLRPTFATQQQIDDAESETSGFYVDREFLKEFGHKLPGLVNPIPPPPFLPPEATKPYTNLEEAAKEQYGQLVDVMDGFREILKSSILGDLTTTWADPELQEIAEAFPDHNSAVREIRRLRMSMESPSRLED